MRGKNGKDGCLAPSIVIWTSAERSADKGPICLAFNTLSPSPHLRRARVSLLEGIHIRLAYDSSFQGSHTCWRIFLFTMQL